MSAGEMIVRLFHARTAAHIAHFQTNSYAQHKALNDFYDAIVGVTDEWVECYQGLFGIIGEYPTIAVPQGKPADWIDSLRQWLKKNRDACCQGETLLENLHDNIQAVCAQTVYKLRCLDNPTMKSEPDGDDMGVMGSMMKW